MTKEEFIKLMEDYDIGGKHEKDGFEVLCDDLCPCHVTCHFINGVFNDALAGKITCEQTFRVHNLLRTDPDVFGRSILFFSEMEAFAKILSDDKSSDNELLNKLNVFLNKYDLTAYYKNKERRIIMENNKKLTKKEIINSLIRDLAEVGYEASRKSLIYMGIGFGLVTGGLMALSCCKVSIKTDKD